VKAFGKPFVVGVISDTHGLLRPEVVAALRGSDRIIHGGDVGDRSILPTLEEIAPLTVVRGNIDTEPWAMALPHDAVLRVGEVKIYVIHNQKELDFDPAARGFAAVVSGHSHLPKQETRGGVLYFNPGSAGPRRFKLPISLGRLVVRGSTVEAEAIELGV
jgi:uncharacterized protein